MHSAVYTNQKGSITIDAVGAFSVSGNNAGDVQALHTMGGNIYINADSVSIMVSVMLFCTTRRSWNDSAKIKIVAGNNIDLSGTGTAVAAVNLNEPDSDSTAAVALTGKM